MRKIIVVSWLIVAGCHGESAARTPVTPSDAAPTPAAPSDATPAPRPRVDAAPAMSPPRGGVDVDPTGTWKGQIPAVRGHGTGNAVELTLSLAELDPRARSVVIVRSRDPRSGTGLVPLSCVDGPIVAEVDRRAFDLARDIHVEVDALISVVPPDLAATFAYQTCIFTADGVLHRPTALAELVGARASESDRSVLTSAGEVGTGNLGAHAVVNTIEPHARALGLVEIEVHRVLPGRPETQCVDVQLAGRHVLLDEHTRVWVEGATTYRPAAQLAVGDQVMTPAGTTVAVTAVTTGVNPCAPSDPLDVEWPNLYFTNGILVHDEGQDDRRQKLNPAPATAAAALGTLARPVAQNYDCQLDVTIDGTALPAGASSVAISATPVHSAVGTGLPADCAHVAATLPRELLQLEPHLVVELADPQVACGKHYAITACVADGNGTLTPTSPAARLGIAGATCVAEGTPILTGDGERAVETLRPGDTLASLAPGDDDPPAASVQVRRVVVHADRMVATFSLSSGRELRVTAEHPLWVSERGAFVVAGEVEPGMHLLGADGQPVMILARTPFDQPARVYDVTVDAPHTYFASGVLVHNY